MINKDIIREWVNELRSGRWKQGINMLNDGNGHYCCLGVLIEICIQSHKVKVEKHAGRDNILYDGEDKFLPASVYSFVGLDEMPAVRDGDYLSDLNDSKVSFDKIADLIEKKFLRKGKKNNG